MFCVINERNTAYFVAVSTQKLNRLYRLWHLEKRLGLEKSWSRLKQTFKRLGLVSVSKEKVSFTSLFHLLVSMLLSVVCLPVWHVRALCSSLHGKTSTSQLLVATAYPENGTHWQTCDLLPLILLLVCFKDNIQEFQPPTIVGNCKVFKYVLWYC